MRWSVLLRVLLSVGRLSHELIVGNPIFYHISFRMRLYLTPMVLLLDIDGAYLDFAFVIGKNISAFSFP